MTLAPVEVLQRRTSLAPHLKHDDRAVAGFDGCLFIYTVRMNIRCLLAMAAIVVVSTALAQKAPAEFAGTIEYRYRAASSTVAQSIYLYRPNGALELLYSRALTSANPWMIGTPETFPDSCAYTRIGDTQGKLTVREFAPITITFNAPGVGEYADRGAATAVSRFVNRPREEMVNTSVRSYLTSGKSAIAGFVISGANARWVLIRAIGPTLRSFGVTSPLSDPGFELLGGDGSELHSAASWSQFDYSPGRPRTESSPPSALGAVRNYIGTSPLSPNSDDAVFFKLLSPGVYSVVTRSVSGSREGEVLTEVHIFP